MASQQRHRGRDWWQPLIALLIIGSSLAILSWSAFNLFSVAANSPDIDSSDRLSVFQNVFNQLMAVVAAWVGAIIAFYFSRENINAVAEGYRDIAAGAGAIDAKLGTLSAGAEMISIDEMDYVPLQTQSVNGRAIAANPIHELIALADNHKRSRVPVLDSSKSLHCVVHRSILFEFVARNGGIQETATPVDVAADQGLFLQDLLDTYGSQVTSAAFVAKNATVAEAKSEMSRIGVNCQDVFVTRTGSRREPILGWLPNTIIANLSTPD